MPWRHPDSCITDKVPTNFNQSHVDQLKDHIVKLRDIPEGVLVRSGLSRVWRNPMCDPVLTHFDNTVISIHVFLCMPFLDKAMVRKEPHGLDISILGRVADRITSPTPAGTVIPRASLEEVVVTRPDPKVVTKADYAAKRKTSTGPEISTNAAKKTRSSQKVSGACSSGLAAGDAVEQTDDDALDDDGQRGGSKFSMEDIGNLDDVSQCEHINVIPLRTFDLNLGLDVTYPLILLLDKEVRAHAELSRGVRRATRASFYASHGDSEDATSPTQKATPAPDTQPLDADPGADEIASDGNVDPYYEARVSNTARDVLERDLLPFVLGPYYLSYPYEEGSRINWDKKHRKYRNEMDALVLEKAKTKEELIGTKSQLKHRERQAREIQDSIASFFQSDFTPLVRKFLKSSEFNRAFAGVLNTTISVGVERGLRKDCTDEEFRGLSQKVVGFTSDAKEKFDRVIAAFLDTTFLFLDKTSSATVPLRASTHIRNSTSSSETLVILALQSI
nr:hypothetical protein [Tanacetum cinerariifolium]